MNQFVFLLFQLYYFICANALNNLLLRKDLSYWAKGMQIRFNLSHLEQWIRDKIPYVRILFLVVIFLIECLLLINIFMYTATRCRKHIIADCSSITATTSQEN